MEKLLKKIEANSNYKAVSHNYFILDDYSTNMCKKISEDGKRYIILIEQKINNYYGNK